MSRFLARVGGIAGLLAGLLAAPVPSASAADLLTPVLHTAAPLPYYSWTGCYIGGHVGGGWGQSGFNKALLAALIATNFLGQNNNALPETVAGGAQTTGFVGGGQAGCNYQLAHLLIGAETDVSGASLNGSGGPVYDNILPPGGSASYRTNLLIDVTGRLGYAVGPLLIYGKGGAAWSNNSYTLVASDGTPWSWSGTHPGWTAGGGIEYAFWRGWSAKVEYRYYNFNVSGSLANPAGMTTTARYTEDAHTITIGLNWHFWTVGTY
ncbi:MAG: porin family protein [Xanthobacteraceae bacterium]|nr:porin family protein [Xanthobacteraceae bacterium]